MKIEVDLADVSQYRLIMTRRELGVLVSAMLLYEQTAADIVAEAKGRGDSPFTAATFAARNVRVSIMGKQCFDALEGKE